MAAGKPAMVYFSTEPVAPQQLDSAQWERLKEFKAWCESKGLVQTFENSGDFRDKFSRQMQIMINANEYIRSLIEEISEESRSDSVPVRSSSQLSEEARHLLLEASNDGLGIILKQNNLTGKSLQTNGKSFGAGGDPRAIARWEYALEQLVEEGLVDDKDMPGEIYTVTHHGYEIVKLLDR